MASWDPGQYARFADHRLRPAADLVARLPEGGFRAGIDLGCGGGQLTALLRARFPALPLAGIDNSPAMLDVARRHLADADFRLGDICDPGVAAGCDLIASNAAFQWLPDHRPVLAALVGGLAPGGVLAVQMPRNHAAPSHVLLAETAAAGRFAAALDGVAGIRAVDDAPDYAALLLAAGAGAVDAWATTYVHILAPAAGSHPVFEWVKGTALRPYLDALPPGLAADFAAAYRGRLAAAYPPLPDGRVLFPFRRVFFVAVK
ncbi:methyltransferase domain-containing protein [Zavarzinia compransoris]|uniref:Trans-aconitate 2-methyltransferase n=1 Tax=Zavarzinia compransoris TaxID=1264899 RepID=A0A317E4M8_9PROT|nr:methyltransferase domain-containing protein [Zavarzinia compransoris]PWR21949.1 trans-aconitate 2-methyltransferase [Zavarzinia compransoris]TDP47313.1 trans-aconitate 2-methyltransferase [Zavarzinia compransoris]